MNDENQVIIGMIACFLTYLFLGICRNSRAVYDKMIQIMRRGKQSFLATCRISNFDYFKIVFIIHSHSIVL